MALAALPLGARAETTEEAAAAFGARESVLGMTLSPSGRYVAFIGSGPGHEETLNVIDLDGDMTVKSIFSSSEKGSDISRCDWATDKRLVCRISVIDDSQGMLIGFSRLIALDRDGADPIVLTPRMSSRSTTLRQFGGDLVALESDGQEGRILMTKQYLKERSVGTRFASNEEGLGVEAVDVENGRTRSVEKADLSAADYIADENGRIRLVARVPDAGATGRLGDRLLFFFRPKDSDSWEKLSEARIDSQTHDGIVPVAVDSSLNIAYAFDNSSGYQRLIAIPLDGSDTARVVLAREDADVDYLMQIGRQRRVVGASYATEKRQVEYFDKELAGLASQLTQALPRKPLIDFIGASADENRLLIVASSDTDPGQIYLFDKARTELNELLPLRRGLLNRPMGTMKPITFPAADGTSIPGYLTLPPGSDGKGLPAIVLPHGGPSSRDEWGFDWLVQFFASRGYAVLQPNYRGSSGYGEAWFGRNGFQAWETAVGDVNDAGRWLVEQGIGKAEQLAIVGWSYGGYAALQSQVLDPDLYKAVVAIAPVTDLGQMMEQSRLYTNSALVEAFVGNGPHVKEGSPAQHAAKFRSPVQIFHGTHDLNVNIEQSRLMVDRLSDVDKEVEYHEFRGLAHSLSDGKARTEMLTKIDGFLSKTLGQ